MTLLFIGAYGGHAATLPRPGDTIDAGDGFDLRDGSRVVLHRALNEIAIQRSRLTPVAAMLRQAGITQEPLVTIDHGGSKIVDVYDLEDPRVVMGLLAVKEEEVVAFPVLVDPQSRLRSIATDEIIVQFRDGVGPAEASRLLSQQGLEVLEGPVPSAPGQYLVRAASVTGQDILARATEVAGWTGVEWAQANFLRELEFQSVPNDLHFGKQQYLRNLGQNGAVPGADVDAASAWDITTGKPEVVVAIIDTGVDITHPELSWLSGKIFINPNESGFGRETNGIDDDGNGYIDDWQGWDFYSHDNNPQPGTTVGAAHGTSCAGIAAAQGNDGQGIAGVAYGCKILPIKLTDQNGATFPGDYWIGRAIRYAGDYADVLSSSWSAGSDGDVIRSAIDYATTSGRNGKGSPTFFASGNNGSITWWVERFKFAISSGTYCFSFYFQEGPPDFNQEWVGLDNIALLSSDQYTYLEPSFPRVDFETGTIPAGWSLHRGGGATEDWLLWNSATIYPTPFHGTASAWCLRTPYNEPPQNGWVEFRSPYMVLNGSYVLRFVRHRSISPGSQFKVRLLDTSGQVVQTLGSVTGLAGGDFFISFPATYVNSMAVGAVTDHDLYADYSCYHTRSNPNVTGLFCVGPSNQGWNDVTTLDIAGPNGDDPGDTRYYFGGTSAATPCVAGAAALVFSKNSELTCQQAKDALQNGCEQIGDEQYTGGKALHYGYGRPSASRSLSLYTPADTTAPTVTSVATRTGRRIEVTFSEKMGSGVTIPSYHTLTGPGKGTLASNPSSVSWVSGNQYLLEWTSGLMVANFPITVAVSPSVKDVAGNSISPSANSGNSTSSRIIHAINCGPVRSSATDPIHPFESQRNYWSGVGMLGDMAINSIVNNDGTPTGVYKTERVVLCSTTYPGDIIHTLPNISSGVNHTVRLYFANNGYSIYPGDVIFDIYINNVLKASNFDLIGQAGGSNIGIWRDYPNITANGSGQIIVKIVPKVSSNRTWGWAFYYNGTISGIKVTAQ